MSVTTDDVDQCVTIQSLKGSLFQSLSVTQCFGHMTYQPHKPQLQSGRITYRSGRIIGKLRVKTPRASHCTWKLAANLTTVAYICIGRDVFIIFSASLKNGPALSTRFLGVEEKHCWATRGMSSPCHLSSKDKASVTAALECTIVAILYLFTSVTPPSLPQRPMTIPTSLKTEPFF